MATLLIRFHDMFLYVRRNDSKGKPVPDVVLLPSGRGKHVHAATVVGSRLDHKLEQTEVTFCHRVGGQFIPIPGSQSRERAEQPRLVDLADVLGKDGGVARPELLANEPGAFPASLNARVVLPNGRAVAHRARRRDAEDVKWTFERKGNLKVIESQELTDTLHVEVNVPPHSDIFAVFSKESIEPVRLEATLQGNYIVTFHNEDQGCTGGEVKPGEYTLEEYRFLYELTKADSSLYRFPTGKYGDEDELLAFDPDDPRSKCLPICGGADCPEG